MECLQSVSEHQTPESGLIPRVSPECLQSHSGNQPTESRVSARVASEHHQRIYGGQPIKRLVLTADSSRGSQSREHDCLSCAILRLLDEVASFRPAPPPHFLTWHACTLHGSQINPPCPPPPLLPTWHACALHGPGWPAATAGGRSGLSRCSQRQGQSHGSPSWPRQ